MLNSSVETIGRHVTVCPQSTITFTCSDSQVPGLTWLALPLLNQQNSPGLALGSDIGSSVTVEGIFTITVISIENSMGILVDMVSTLTVMVNDMIQNGTNVTCFTSNVGSLLIFKKGEHIATLCKVPYSIVIIIK